MKKRFLQFGMTAKAVMIALLLGVAGKTYAYDFSAVCETGQTLYYNITNAEYHYVELTHPGSFGGDGAWNGYEKPTGNIIIPKYVYDANDDLYFVTSIGSQAFRQCNGLISVTISSFVTSIDYSAFQLCNGLEQIVVNSQNTVYDSRGNCNAIIETSTNELIIGCKNTIIPNTVTSIGRTAFYGCSDLTSVTIPNSVTTIDYYAFLNCIGLTSIFIPNSVTTIGNSVLKIVAGLNNSWWTLIMQFMIQEATAMLSL